MNTMVIFICTLFRILLTMDTYGTLKLRYCKVYWKCVNIRFLYYSWAQGHPGKWINFISTDTLVYGGPGNTLNVIKSNGEHQCSVASLGVGVGPVVCCAVGNLIAYAESTLQPRIFIVKYPTFELVSTMEGLLLYIVSLSIEMYYRWCSDELQ